MDHISVLLLEKLAQIMQITNIILSPDLSLFRLDYIFTNLSLQLVQIMPTHQHHAL